MVHLALLSTLGGGACTYFWPPKQPCLILSGTVECHTIAVGSRIGGRVTEVLVSEGDRVQKNQILVRFDRYDLLALQEQAQAMINQVQAELVRLRTGFQREEIEEVRSAAEAARAQLDLVRHGPASRRSSGLRRNSGRRRFGWKPPPLDWRGKPSYEKKEWFPNRDWMTCGNNGRCQRPA